MNPADIHAAAARGDFTQVPAAIAELSARGAGEADAWLLALTARLRLVDPAAKPMSPAAIEALAEAPASVRRTAVRGCVDEVLAYGIGFDIKPLRQLLPAFETLGSQLEDARAQLGLALAQTWLEMLATGGDERLLELTVDLAARASRAKLPDLVVLATVQQALVALGQNDVETATAIARRASRMARTEGILTAEYLANLVLARVRRYAGTPHLAARILGALQKVCPAPWRGWVAWELILTGDVRAAEGTNRTANPNSRAAIAATAAQTVLDAATAGDSANFERFAPYLAQVAAPISLLSRDTNALLTALRTEASANAAPEMQQWLDGAVSTTPSPLTGLCIPDVDDTGNEVAGAFVLCRPATPARRVLRHALGLVDPTAARGHSLAHARSNTALAVLAFSGAAGLSDAELFRSVYGFEFAEQHSGTLRQLARRMRAEIGDRGSVDRTDDGYVLRLAGICAIPDPRCAPDPDEMILRFLAARDGRASARDISAALGVALRTVQLALKRLVDDGACETVRRGRTIDYKLEDTTFAEPSITRLSPKGA